MDLKRIYLQTGMVPNVSIIEGLNEVQNSTDQTSSVTPRYDTDYIDRSIPNWIWILVITVAVTFAVCLCVLKFVNSRLTRWQKFNDRGCSYDVTTYLVIENEYEHVQGKEPVKKGIQRKIDNRILNVTKQYTSDEFSHNNNCRGNACRRKAEKFRKVDMNKKFSKNPGILYAVNSLRSHKEIHRSSLKRKVNDSLTDSTRSYKSASTSSSDTSDNSSVFWKEFPRNHDCCDIGVQTANFVEHL